MRTAIVVAVLLALTSSVSADDGTTPAKTDNAKFWSFHGLTLGASEATVKAAFPEFPCENDAHLRRCTATINFKKRPGVLSDFKSSPVSLVFLEDKLVNINIAVAPNAFDASVKELTKAYGAPLSDRKSTMKAGLIGRSVENRMVTWHNGNSTVRFEKYYQNTGSSRLLYALP